MTYPIHPAATAFPMLDDARLRELAQDIRANGLHEAIRLFEGQILDGRNRMRACEEAGVLPRFESLPLTTDPWSYVWSLNGERRDLKSDEQRTLIFKKCEAHSQALTAERARIQAEANRKRSEAQTGNRNAAKNSSPSTRGTTVSTPKSGGDKNASSAAIAQLAKVSRPAVERAEMIERARPDLAERVMAGEMPASAAIREIRREALVERLDDVSVREAKRAEGVYDVIVIDPPWPMEKFERDVRPNQTGQLDYPTMRISELETLKIPAADDCHVWLWTTHKFLPDALCLLDAWALKYVCAFVWHKPGGPQPWGLPQYNCEFALYARRGAPQFVDTKHFFTAFDAARGAHSEKPEAFYDVLRRVTAGRRLDMFNRRVIEGFDGWGKEAVA